MTIKTHKAIEIGRSDTGFFYNRSTGVLTFKVGGTTIWTATSTAAASTAVLLAGAQTITGVKTMSGANIITHANTGLKVQESGGAFNVSIVPGAEAADRSLAIPVLGGADTIMTLATAQVITGIKSFSAMPRIKRSAVVVGAGTVQADAALLSEGFQTVSGANGTVGVKLPVAVAGMVVMIKGITNGVLKVWPNSGAGINAVGADTAMSLASGLVPAIFIADSATQWYTFPLLPS